MWKSGLGGFSVLEVDLLCLTKIFCIHNVTGHDELLEGSVVKASAYRSMAMLESGM